MEYSTSHETTTKKTVATPVVRMTHHHHSQTAFDNPAMFAKKFDAPERDAWQKPDEVIDSLRLSDNAVVVEIGAGTGYFTVRLSDHVKNGRIIALDQAPQMVEFLKKRVEELGLTNVDVRLAKQNGSMRLQEKADVILCVDVYHHIEDRSSYFSSVAQNLKRNGTIVIIDLPVDSPMTTRHAHRTPAELVKKEMEQAGLLLVEELDFLLPYQFYLAFKPATFKE